MTANISTSLPPALQRSYLELPSLHFQALSGAASLASPGLIQNTRAHAGLCIRAVAQPGHSPNPKENVRSLKL